MEILFVSSANKIGSISPIVLNQAQSLGKMGLSITHFGIKGRGVYGYLSNVFKLRSFVKGKRFDLVHVHYAFSAYAVTIACLGLPIIVSLMGSDTMMNPFYNYVNRFLSNHFWQTTILKSVSMNEKLKLTQYFVIPNGVDIEKFFPYNRNEACKYTGFDPKVINIVFLANPERKEKNFRLAKEAINIIVKDYNIEFKVFYNLANDEIPLYLNAADIIISSSLWEGSPNVIKEAMACNTCVVSTNVGDVEWLFTETDGYFLVEPDPQEFAKGIMKAIDFIHSERKPNGRERIIKLKLDSLSKSSILNIIYNNALKPKK